MANNTGSIDDIRKKFHATHELITTSYHESGHIIYGLLHNMNIGSVLVFADKKSKRIHGLAYYDPPDLGKIQDYDLFIDRLHAEIGLSYAGFVAEMRYFKMISGLDKLPFFIKEGSSNDFSEASALFKKYNLMPPGKKRYAYKQKLIKQVDKELLDNWDAVVLVSHALVKKKKLSFDELKLLLIKKSKNKEFWKKQFIMHHALYFNSESIDENNMKYILSL